MKQGQHQWDIWCERHRGDSGEDLAAVLAHVRLGKTLKTQFEWRRMDRTRAFCDLRLYLLHEYHFTAVDLPPTSLKMFRNLSGEILQENAPRIIVDDVGLSDALNKQAWTDTWQHQGAYFDDLLSYLFRPGPTNRRMRLVHEGLSQASRTHTLGELVRVGCQAELEATFDDPVLALQTFIQAALPGHPAIRALVYRLENIELTHRARLYEALLPRYGFALPDDVNWRDMAQIFNDTIAGTLVRGRAEGGIPTCSNGTPVLTATVLAVMPSLCGVTPAEFENRRPRNSPDADS